MSYTKELFLNDIPHVLNKVLSQKISKRFGILIHSAGFDLVYLLDDDHDVRSYIEIVIGRYLKEGWEAFAVCSVQAIVGDIVVMDTYIDGKFQTIFAQVKENGYKFHEGINTTTLMLVEAELNRIRGE